MTTLADSGRQRVFLSNLRKRISSFLLDWGIIYYLFHGSMYLYLAIWGSQSLRLYNYYKFNHDVAFFNPLQFEPWHWWIVLFGTLFFTILIRTFGRSLGQRSRRYALQSRTGEKVSLGRRLLRVIAWPLSLVVTPIELAIPAGRRRLMTEGVLHDRVSDSVVATYVRPANVPRKKAWKTQWGWVVVGLIAISSVLGWIIIDADFGEILSPNEETQRMIVGLTSPDFSHFTVPEPGLTEHGSEVEHQKYTIRELMFITLLMALIATVLGGLLAFPLSFLGARNLMAGTLGGRFTYSIVRGFFNLFRSIEILIWVAIFAKWIGYGNAFTGTMALVIHTIAALGKLFSEQVESIDPGPLEAIRAAGGSKFQVIRYGVIPQIVPSFLAFTLYRWDINVRMATIVSLVGGGGIGALLFWYRHTRDFSQLGAVILVIVVVVWALDYVSGRVRERIV